MRRERRGRCLALALALAVACLLALPGRGARGFDVRVGDPFGSPHLPGVLPAPFACFGPAPEGDRAHGRAFGVLHANLFDLPGLTLDGAGAAAWHRRAWLRAGISRLAAPEFAEWSAALAAGGRVGPMVECRRLWTQPSSELIRTAAIVPEQAWSVLAGWTQPVGRRATVRVWGQDLIRRGAVRATGLRPRWGGEVRLRAAPGVEVRAARQWDRDGSATRIECAWELTSDLSVGGGWRDPRRGRGCWLRAGWGKASAWVWSESMVAELPATSGIGLVWESHSHGIAGAATHAPGPAGQSAGQSVSRSAGQPAGRSVGQPAGRSVGPPVGPPVGRSVGQPAGRSVGPPAGQSVGQPTDQPAVPSVGRPARLPAGRPVGEPAAAPGRIEDPAARSRIEAPDDPAGAIRLGGVPLLEATEEDSLGARADSLSLVGDAVEGRETRMGAVPGPPRGGHAGPVPVPLGDVTIDLLRERAGLEEAEAAELAQRLRGVRSGTLATHLPVEAGLARAYVAAAPYLTARDPGESSEDAQWRARRWQMRYTHNLRASRQRDLRSSERLTFEAPCGAGELRVAATRAVRPDAGPTRGFVRWDAPGIHVVAGRGGDPLTWGVGLAGRARSIDLPSPGEGAPTAGDGPDDGGRALLPLPSLWHPTFGGDEPLVGCECDVAAGLRLLGAAVADGLRAGAIATRGPWRVGALVQGADREWMPDLWLSRRSAGEEIQVEAVRQTDGRWWAGTRVIGAHGLGARGRIFWWDLQARVPVPGRGPDMSIRGERAASPEARRQGSLGWRGRRGSCAATWTEVQSSGADPRLRQTVSRKASGQGRLSLPGGGSAAVRCDWTARTRRREDRDGLPWTIESAQSERRGRVRATWWRPSSSAGRGLPGCRLAQWGGELGLEVSASGAERKATAPGRWSGVWWGVGATRYSARFGVLQVTAPSGGIDLTPSWAEGTGGRLRGGLWAAARVDGRAGPLRLVARALLPTPARDGAARPWVLSMLVQMDAAGRPAATPGAED